MKRFLTILVLFCFIFIIIDRACGYICDWLQENSNGGNTRNINYIIKHSNEDILMFGSSRMHHHYVPEIIKDSLNMTAYNCGVDGNGIITAYGYLRIITERYIPKFVIYDFYANYDLFQNSDNNKYLTSLKPYYDHPGISEIFADVDPKEKYKMKSKLYRYNSQIPELLADYRLSAIKHFNGYSGLSDVMQEELSYDDDNNYKNIVDSLKLHYMRRFVNLCKEKSIKLVFAISPAYKCKEAKEIEYFENICIEEAIPIYNFYSLKYFNDRTELFSNRMHLNDKGAKIYTSMLMNCLKQR